MKESVAIPERRGQSEPLVAECIDFRTREGNRLWLARRGFAEGSYRVYASAGASGNPAGLLEAVQVQNPSIIKVLDHEDCKFYDVNGFYQLFESNGHAPHDAHHHNLEMLGMELHKRNKNVDYRYNLLPLNKEQRKRHTCPAVVVELGEPDIVKTTRQTMAELGLADNYDKITRPYTLSPQDSTIWNDLQISLRLHQPTRLFIFDRDEQNASNIAQIASNIHPDLAIISVVVDKLSQEKQPVAVA